MPTPHPSGTRPDHKGTAGDALAKSLEILAGLPGACERLFPGFAKFESSIDERVLTERNLLRGALVRQKLRALELNVAKGHAWLDGARNPEQLADTSLSGISLAEYYRRCFGDCGFSETTLSLAQFLVGQRRLLKLCASMATMCCASPRMPPAMVETRTLTGKRCYRRASIASASAARRC